MPDLKELSTTQEGSLEGAKGLCQGGDVDNARIDRRGNREGDADSAEFFHHKSRLE